jgi:hypothetical protein
MPLDPRQEQELTDGGDSLLHYHLQDRATNSGLQSAARIVSPTTTPYNIRADEDFLVFDTSGGAKGATLPLARNGREIEIILLTGGNDLTLTPQSGDTIMGQSDAVLSGEGTALRFKAINSNWVAI